MRTFLLALACGFWLTSLNAQAKEQFVDVGGGGDPSNAALIQMVNTACGNPEGATLGIAFECTNGAAAAPKLQELVGATNGNASAAEARLMAELTPPMRAYAMKSCSKTKNDLELAGCMGSLIQLTDKHFFELARRTIGTAKEFDQGAANDAYRGWKQALTDRSALSLACERALGHYSSMTVNGKVKRLERTAPEDAKCSASPTYVSSDKIPYGTPVAEGGSCPRYLNGRDCFSQNNPGMSEKDVHDFSGALEKWQKSENLELQKKFLATEMREFMAERIVGKIAALSHLVNAESEAANAIKQGCSNPGAFGIDKDFAGQLRNVAKKAAEAAPVTPADQDKFFKQKAETPEEVARAANCLGRIQDRITELAKLVGPKHYRTWVEAHPWLQYIPAAHIAFESMLVSKDVEDSFKAPCGPWHGSNVLGAEDPQCNEVRGEIQALAEEEKDLTGKFPYLMRDGSGSKPFYQDINAASGKPLAPYNRSDFYKHLPAAEKASVKEAFLGGGGCMSLKGEKMPDYQPDPARVTAASKGLDHAVGEELKIWTGALKDACDPKQDDAILAQKLDDPEAMKAFYSCSGLAAERTDFAGTFANGCQYRAALSGAACSVYTENEHSKKNSQMRGDALKGAMYVFEVDTLPAFAAGVGSFGGEVGSGLKTFTTKLVAGKGIMAAAEGGGKFVASQAPGFLGGAAFGVGLQEVPKIFMASSVEGEAAATNVSYAAGFSNDAERKAALQAVAANEHNLGDIVKAGLQGGFFALGGHEPNIKIGTEALADLESYAIKLGREAETASKAGTLGAEDVGRLKAEAKQYRKLAATLTEAGDRIKKIRTTMGTDKDSYQLQSVNPETGEFTYKDPITGKDLKVTAQEILGDNYASKGKLTPEQELSMKEGLAKAYGKAKDEGKFKGANTAKTEQTLLKIFEETMKKDAPADYYQTIMDNFPTETDKAVEILALLKKRGKTDSEIMDYIRKVKNDCRG